jgi:hypothetical protein
MDQRSSILDLPLKGMLVQTIHDDLIATLSNKALAHSTVTIHNRQSPFKPRRMFTSPHFDDSDRAVLATLEEKSFSSVRKLARATHLQFITVHKRLTNSLGFVLCHLRWVPHILSSPQKLQPVDLSSSLVWTLEVQERRAWHDIVTLDGSWFYDSTDYESIWPR